MYNLNCLPNPSPLHPSSRHLPVALDPVATIAQRAFSSLPPNYHPPALAIREHKKSAIAFNYTQLGNIVPEKDMHPIRRLDGVHGQVLWLLGHMRERVVC
jgi:hypothetical protein